jgi:hypothetical protein
MKKYRIVQTNLLNITLAELDSKEKVKKWKGENKNG